CVNSSASGPADAPQPDEFTTRGLNPQQPTLPTPTRPPRTRASPPTRPVPARQTRRNRTSSPRGSGDRSFGGLFAGRSDDLAAVHRCVLAEGVQPGAAASTPQRADVHLLGLRMVWSAVLGSVDEQRRLVGDRHDPGVVQFVFGDRGAGGELGDGGAPSAGPGRV